MDFLIGIILLVLFIIVCRKLSRFFFRTATYVEEREQEKKYFQEHILHALNDVREAVVKHEPPVDMRENLLTANRELIKKKRLTEAIKDELGINMYEDSSK